MEPLLKYIIYFLLGLICHYLLFNGDLIEGLTCDGIFPTNEVKGRDSDMTVNNVNWDKSEAIIIQVKKGDDLDELEKCKCEPIPITNASTVRLTSCGYENPKYDCFNASGQYNPRGTEANRGFECSECYPLECSLATSSASCTREELEDHYNANPWLETMTQRGVERVRKGLGFRKCSCESGWTGDNCASLAYDDPYIVASRVSVESDLNNKCFSKETIDSYRSIGTLKTTTDCIIDWVDDGNEMRCLHNPVTQDPYDVCEVSEQPMMRSFSVEGLPKWQGPDGEERSNLSGVFTRDAAAPEANGRPHWSTEEGGHLYSTDGRWILNADAFAPTETWATAFFATTGPVPVGAVVWQYDGVGDGNYVDMTLTILDGRRWADAFSVASATGQTTEHYKQMCFMNDNDGKCKSQTGKIRQAVDQNECEDAAQADGPWTWEAESMVKINTDDECKSVCSNIYTPHTNMSPALAEQLDAEPVHVDNGFKCGGYTFDTDKRCCIYKNEYVQNGDDLPPNLKKMEISNDNNCLVTADVEKINILDKPCLCVNNDKSNNCLAYQYCMDGECKNIVENGIKVNDKQSLLNVLSTCNVIDGTECKDKKEEECPNDKCKWIEGKCGYKNPNYESLIKSHITNFCKSPLVTTQGDDGGESKICNSITNKYGFWNGPKSMCENIVSLNPKRICNWKDVCKDASDDECPIKPYGGESEIITSVNEPYGCYCNENLSSVCPEGNYCSNIKTSNTPIGICKSPSICLSSDKLLEESCKDEEGKFCHYINTSSDAKDSKNVMYNDIFDPKCKEIQDCQINDNIIPEDGHCFCMNPNANEPRLCLPGNMCNASGCHTKKCPKPGYSPNDSNICTPPSCSTMENDKNQIYSNTNKEVIKNDCICETDIRNEEDTIICPSGNYCIDSSVTQETPLLGCHEQVYNYCDEYSETNLSSNDEKCICKQDKVNNPDKGNIVCNKGNYCFNPEGCRQVRCLPGTKINPEDHKKCIPDLDNEENVFEKIQGELKQLIDFEKIQGELKQLIDFEKIQGELKQLINQIKNKFNEIIK